jgi:hypothetical protein
VGIVVVAIIVTILTCVCLGMAYKRKRSKKAGSYGTYGNGVDNPVYETNSEK